MRRFFLGFAAIVAIVWLSGCGNGPTPYTFTGKSNLSVHNRMEGSGVQRGYLGVYFVDKNCQAYEQGVIKLNDDVTDLSLPENQLVYLVYTLNQSGFLQGRSTLKQGSLLYVRQGASYEYRFTYIDDLYEASLHEKEPKSGKLREVQMRDFSACTPTN